MKNLPAPSTRPSAAPDRQLELPAWGDVAESGDNLAYEDFLSFRLGRLYTLVQRETSTRYLEPVGLTLPEWRVLARVAQRSSLEMRELARLSLMDKAAISRSVDSLLARGLVARHTDPAHAKRRIVAITPAGRRLTRKVLPAAHRAQASLLRLLAPAEREAMAQAITKLTNSLLRAETSPPTSGDDEP
jgi:DNA-binding MarR family transcriptional regulator